MPKKQSKKPMKKKIAKKKVVKKKISKALSKKKTVGKKAVKAAVPKPAEPRVVDQARVAMPDHFLAKQGGGRNMKKCYPRPKLSALDPPILITSKVRRRLARFYCCHFSVTRRGDG